VPVLSRLEERLRETWKLASQRRAALLPRFVAAVEKVGAVIREAPEARTVGFSVAALAKARGITLCQAVDPDLVGALHLDSALTEAGVALASGPSPEGAVRAGMGITRATAGIAETGSIICHADEVDGRLLGMLPEVHVALLHQDTVVETLEEGLLITRYLVLQSHLQGRPSYLSWVTGPSRTADIERVLTIGVHGPRELHVFLLPPAGKRIGL
jgi:L-lactate dehydrogenase complex protein LldG